MYFDFLKLYIENFIDCYFELPDFDDDIIDEDYVQTAPKIIQYTRHDVDDDFIKVIII